MRTIGRLLLFVACFPVFTLFASAQSIPFVECGVGDVGAMRTGASKNQAVGGNRVQSVLTDQPGGRYITAKDTLHALIVFVQLLGDTSEPTYSPWQVGQAPTFLNTYIDSLPSQQSTNWNLTHYFRQMSLGKLTLTGKTRWVITPHSQRWYFDRGWNRWLINKEVLDSLDQSLDFAEFDRWRRYGEYDIRREVDGWVDMIFMVYRHLDGLPESRSVMGFSGGEASLGYARTWDPYFEPTEIDVDGGTRHIGNGHPYFGDPGSGVTTVIAGYGDSWFGYTPYRVAIHELSHYWMMDGTDYGHHGDGFWAMLNSFGARFDSQNVR